MCDVQQEKEKALQCLKQLRDSLTDDVDLKLPIHDENFLIRFVRGKKYDVALAHKTVRKYYTLQLRNPNVSRNLFPNQAIVKQILDTGVLAVLKHKDPLGRPILISNMPLWDPEKFGLDIMVAAGMLVMEELLFMTLEAQLNGIVILCDADGFSMQHAKQYTFKRLKFIMDMYQGSFPVRLKGLHIVNEGRILGIAYSMARPFMSPKFKEGLQFHGHNFEKLHELIPASILPKQFGGTLNQCQAYDKDFITTLYSRDSYYQELLNYGYNNWESKDSDTYTM